MFSGFLLMSHTDWLIFSTYLIFYYRCFVMNHIHLLSQIISSYGYLLFILIHWILPFLVIILSGIKMNLFGLVHHFLSIFKRYVVWFYECVIKLLRIISIWWALGTINLGCFTIFLIKMICLNKWVPLHAKNAIQYLSSFV